VLARIDEADRNILVKVHDDEGEQTTDNGEADAGTVDVREINEPRADVDAESGRSDVTYVETVRIQHLAPPVAQV